MRLTTWAAALLCGLALALPVAAQDAEPQKELPPAPTTPPTETPESAEAAPAAPAPKKKMEFGDPPLHRWGGMTVTVAAWEPDLIGADEEIATLFPNGNANPLMQGSTSHIRETIGAAYHLPKDVGSIGVTYESMAESDGLEYLSPGQFIYYESRAYPFARGVYDDGFADGVSTNLIRKTREFRLYYSQTAFQNAKAKGTWAAGYRQVSHSRNVDISYLAIVPNLPPLIPPIVDSEADAIRLQPFPDQVLQTSNYTGHGLGVNFDLEFPVHERVSIITGLSIGLIRGSVSSAFSSQTAYYYQGDRSIPLTYEQLFNILNTGTTDDIHLVGQQIVHAGLTQSSVSQFAETVDIYLGIEVWVYKGLKVFGTLRDEYFSNVGQYVVPAPGFLSNERTQLSAGYEGYVLGLSWRF